MSDRAEQEKLLIVDDEPGNIRVLNETLRSSYRIFSANNGREALEIAALVQPDLVLLDIKMPGMDGYDVCRTMQANPHLSPIPIIFVTALSGEEDESTGLALGAVDYITKPFRPAIVRQRVGIHLELKRQRDQLSRLCRVDGLTGIPNRRAFDELLCLEWRRAMRSGNRLSLAMIDIDRFKEFNDMLGHPAGDDCLRRVAQALTQSLQRAGDFVARYGGDEFACILPGSDDSDLAAVFEKMRASVASLLLPCNASWVTPEVTISVGVACCTPTQETLPAGLIARADEQLYWSKSQGRNRVTVALCGG